MNSPVYENWRVQLHGNTQSSSQNDIPLHLRSRFVFAIPLRSPLSLANGGKYHLPHSLLADPVSPIFLESKTLERPTMSILSGDRYLDHLVRFVDSHAAQLLDRTLTLKLNPVGLHYVYSRLESLREIETLLSVAPVDYLRSYVADLGDHRALERLRRILGLLTSLKVVSGLGNNKRDPSLLCLVPFSRLRVLELRGCDLSKAEPKGLLELRHTLERLVCHNSTVSGFCRKNFMLDLEELGISYGCFIR